MDIRIRIVLVTSIIICSGIAYGMNENAITQSNQSKKLKIYAIPGLKGRGSNKERGSEEWYVNTIFKGCDYTLKSLDIPEEEDTDLGQEKTTDILYNTLQEDAKHNDQDTIAILHATSRGAANAFHLFERYNKLHEIIKIRAALFEGTYATIEQGIARSLEGDRAPKRYRILRIFPYPEIWAPYLTRLLEFPHYWPAGPQPIKALPYIPKDLVMVFMHGDNDQRVLDKNSEALLYGAFLHAIKNVYYISKRGGDHIHLLEEKDIPILHAILRKHHILPAQKNENEQDIDLKPYQPDAMQYIKIYNRIHAQHRIHEHIDTAWRATKIAAGTAAIYWTMNKLLKKDEQPSILQQCMHYVHDAVQEAMGDKQLLLSNILALIDHQMR